MRLSRCEPSGTRLFKRAAPVACVLSRQRRSRPSTGCRYRRPTESRAVSLGSAPARRRSDEHRNPRTLAGASHGADRRPPMATDLSAFQPRLRASIAPPRVRDHRTGQRHVQSGRLPAPRMTEIAAILGLLATMTLLTTGLLALIVWRQREQIRHCIQIVTTLLKAYEAE